MLQNQCLSGNSFISIPTTLSHDGIAVLLAWLKVLINRIHQSTGASAIIADTGSYFPGAMASTVTMCDVISKFTAVKDWRSRIWRKTSTMVSMQQVLL